MMESKHEIAVRQETETEPSIMSIVQQIAASPNAKEQVAVMQALLDMKERQEDREAKRMFIDALTELQGRIPPIGKHGIIKDRNGATRSRYALAEDVCEVVDPLMHEYGFSYTQSVAGIKDGMREFVGTLLHRGGYEKTLSCFLPLDKSQFRTDVQSEGSTNSYTKRVLYKAHFNIREVGVDDDGSGQGLETISEDEAKDLEIKLQDAKANLGAFLKYFEIAELKELRRSELARAHEMIDRKARK